MRLSLAPVQFAHDEDALPSRLGRAPAVITLTGCVMTVIASILPWGEKATFGFSLTTIHGEDLRLALAVLAVACASLAGAAVLRRQSTAGVAMLLIVLAVAQVGAAIWFGGTVLSEIRAAHPNLVLISAIGTGVYMAWLGSVGTLIGAILAWTRRRIE